MICRVEVRWPGNNEDLTLEKYNSLCQVQLKEEVKEKPSYFYCEEVVGDLDNIVEVLTPLGFTVEIKNFKQNVFVGLLGHKLDTPFGPNDFRGTMIPPNTTHVHIPNLGLLLIDEVQHMDDACTDALQRELDQGWRILAVCPPNGTRRPDYILGRTKEK